MVRRVERHASGVCANRKLTIDNKRHLKERVARLDLEVAYARGRYAEERKHPYCDLVLVKEKVSTPIISIQGRFPNLQSW